MSEMLYKINWHTHGFKPKDLSEDEWALLTKEFVRLHNKYCEITNGRSGYERINKDFNWRYGDIDRSVDGLEAYVYGSYVTWRVNEILLMKKKKFQSEILEPFVFMDGWIPVFGARLKKHGYWSMDFTLKPEEA